MAVEWLTCLEPRPWAAVRLFCFTHAGGRASLFRPWVDRLPRSIEVSAVQLPGRERRFNEPPMTSADAIVEAVTPAILSLQDRPFALFGHSMGSLLAFELARALEARGTPPAHLFVSGRRAPDAAAIETPVHQMPDDAFVAEVNRRYGSIPAELLEHPDLMALLLPVLRADMAVVETYQYRSGRPLSCGLSVFGGGRDSRAPLADLAAWQRQAAQPIALRQFEGGHFYFSDASGLGPLLDNIHATLVPTTPVSGATSSPAVLAPSGLASSLQDARDDLQRT